jgi:hypothetical protein
MCPAEKELPPKEEDAIVRKRGPFSGQLLTAVSGESEVYCSHFLLPKINNVNAEAG